MRHLFLLFAVLGLGLAVWLVMHSGLDAVWGGITAIGWGIVAVTLYHLLPMILDGWAWRLTLPSSAKIGFGRLMLFRWVRESVNAMLPVAEVGGEIIGARLLTLDKVSGGAAGAGVVIDRSLQIVAQALYTLAGLMVLAGVAGGSAYIPWALSALAAAVGLIAIFLLAQRWGLLRLLESGARRLAMARGAADGGHALAGLHEHLMVLYADRRLVAANFGWHFMAWVVNAGEVWLTLYLMGAPVSFAEAVVLHSLGQAARSAAFFVPAGLGVQEGSYIALGGLFGVPPGIALAASLARRAREVALGFPGLLVWQVIEGRRTFSLSP